jgi:putative phosphotransacetylase
VEVSRTDAFALGVKPPVRDSGEHEGSAGQVTVVGPNGALTLTQGVILAKRHVHMTPADAQRFGLKNKDNVKVRCGGPRALIFDQVLVRVHESFALDCHLDTDEANAAMLNNGDEVEILG